MNRYANGAFMCIICRLFFLRGRTSLANSRHALCITWEIQANLEDSYSFVPVTHDHGMMAVTRPQVSCVSVSIPSCITPVNCWGTLCSSCVSEVACAGKHRQAWSNEFKKRGNGLPTAPLSILSSLCGSHKKGSNFQSTSLEQAAMCNWAPDQLRAYQLQFAGPCDAQSVMPMPGDGAKQ